ncbi:MAG: CPBP family intramembrane metalloprotease [Clostridium sp.]|nr:CPBP family intramembrane metalloprotease [Clostridium sp.]
MSVYIFILGSYFILSPYFDLSNVTSSLQNNIGVNKGNFVFVALYISFINSLLEEFFFRGFAFLGLKKVSTKRFAYIFSSSAFALYHVAFMIDWFTPLLFVLMVAGLFIAGMLFNWLNDKNGNIYTSWLVHMCANFSINTIGFILFGILF